MPLTDLSSPWIAQAGARALLAADLHVTLCFLGSVDEARIGDLYERAAGLRARSFTLTFDRIEYWREPRVLVAACADIPDAGGTLAHCLHRAASELGLAPDRKPWRPHMTLARSMTPKRLPAQMPLQQPIPTPLTFSASSFWLAETLTDPRPARYARLASWSLH